MVKESPQYRKKLNSKQLALLHILYRFRFATTELVAGYQEKKSYTSVYPRLATLIEQGYIGRKFEPEYRLQGKYAAYYLLAPGVRVLRKRQDEKYKYSERVLHNILNDSEAADQFVEHNLSIFEAYIQLKQHYGDNLQFFTKSDLAAFGLEHFPDPLPDAYIRLDRDGEARQFFLDLHHEARPFFIAARRIKQYATHADSKKWDMTDSELPKILALCDTTTMQKRLQKRMFKEKRAKPKYFLSTKEELKKMSETANIWQPAMAPSEKLGLEAV